MWTQGQPYRLFTVEKGKTFFVVVVFRINPHTENGSEAVLVEETFSSCGQCDPEVRKLMCFPMIGESLPQCREV